MTAEVTVVDYGIGNIFSVSRALEHSGARVVLSGNADAVAGAERLVLPGVGAFSAAMKLLQVSGLGEAIRRFIDSGRPLLGICVGMQAMMQFSEEFGHSDGFGFIDGGVVGVPDCGADGTPHPVPHIGWNTLAPGAAGWAGSVLADLTPEDAVYFVHSFAAAPTKPENVLATCDYDGRTLTAAVIRDNITGVQFHPEKSGPVGQKILRTFIGMAAA